MNPVAPIFAGVVILIVVLVLWAWHEISNAAICTCGASECRGECLWSDE